MKKIVLIAILMISSFTIYAQSPFDKFENQDDVTSVVMNKKMLELIAKTKSKDKNQAQLLNMVKKLDQIKIFTSESVAKGKELKAVAENYIKSSKLEELMRANNGGKNVKIYVKNGASDSIIKELFMYIEGDARDKNTVVLSLVGNIDLDEISELSEILNLPGSTEIKKASEKK
jgi:ribosomal protein L17